MTYDLLLSPKGAEKAAKLAAQRAMGKQSGDAMSDNKAVGWRKKIHSKPKELQPLKLGPEETGTADDSTDRRRHGWRKTIQGSRPATPVSGPPSTPTTDEVNDAQGERVSCSTPRRGSRPKPKRYTSLFSFKDTTKDFDFSEPWGDERPPFEPLVDPEFAIQCVRTHMHNYPMKPVPVEHNSNLFRIFEAYHKLRDERKRLEDMLHEVQEYFSCSKGQWTKEERRYAEEIRRLELLIAQGTTGMAGVLNARQGTVVDRKRMPRPTISSGGPTSLNEFLTAEQIDTEIKLRSQKVLLQRPTSPSTKMTALSRQFTRAASTDLRVGTPPDGSAKPLSRKVQSELNLPKLARMNTAESIGNSSITSGFSGTGDALPDEISSSPSAQAEITMDCDAIVAIRELGALVARKRGLDTVKFVSGLVSLLSEEDISTSRTRDTGPSHTELGSVDSNPGHKGANHEATPRQRARRSQSRSQLRSDQKARRHFSFEPGEDQLQALKEDLATSDASELRDDTSIATTPSVCRDTRDASVVTPPEIFASPYQIPNHDGYNQSKIPSPVQACGSARRQTSISSLQSIMTKSNDGRHASYSSIQTTINLRPGSSSRSSSFNNLRSTDASSPSSKDRLGSVRVRNSVASLTSDRGSYKAVSPGDSPARSFAKSPRSGPSPRTILNKGMHAQENDEPSLRG